ncbi:translation initiation factor IF-2-like [Choloepus didactylus]|uniref:translation initiation factor IF-2-like n=1 Tax=Choloepus didactylus TaxID=27675 RepID=UPI00189D3809|nr:translation initiation factor IF-2-like [Choloepus didactylus]
MSTPWWKRGGRSQGPAGPPRPLHFYWRRNRVWPGCRSPRLPARPARPMPLPGRCLTPDQGARSAPHLRTGDLISPPASRRSDSRGGGGGCQEQANPAPPGAQRGNGLPAARPAAARSCLAGPPRPAPAVSACLWARAPTRPTPGLPTPTPLSWYTPTAGTAASTPASPGFFCVRRKEVRSHHPYLQH